MAIDQGNDNNNGGLTVDQGLVTAVPLTLACWAYENVDNNNEIHMCLCDKDATNQWFSIGYDTTNHAINYVHASGQSTAATSTTRTLNAWQHVCGVFASA